MRTLLFYVTLFFSFIGHSQTVLPHHLNLASNSSELELGISIQRPFLSKVSRSMTSLSWRPGKLNLRYIGRHDLTAGFLYSQNEFWLSYPLTSTLTLSSSMAWHRWESEEIKTHQYSAGLAVLWSSERFATLFRASNLFIIKPSPIVAQPEVQWLMQYEVTDEIDLISIVKANISIWPEVILQFAYGYKKDWSASPFIQIWPLRLGMEVSYVWNRVRFVIGSPYDLKLGPSPYVGLFFQNWSRASPQLPSH